MEKKCTLFFVSAMILAAAAGCGTKTPDNAGVDTNRPQNTQAVHGTETEIAVDTEHTSQLQLGNAVEIPEGFEGRIAEEEAHRELEQAIAKYCGIREEDFEKTRYYYNYVDLNEDGQNEILAFVFGQDVPQIQGNVLLWLNEERGSLSKDSVRQSFEQVGTPVYISSQKTEGYRNLILTENTQTVSVLKEQGTEPVSIGQSYRELTYTGEKSQELEEGATLDDIRDKKGTAIFTNPIESGLANENCHILGEAIRK